MTQVRTFIAARMRVHGSRAERSTAARERFTLLVHQCLAVVLLVLLSPTMLVVVACLWRADGLPVFFAHYRVGQDGRLFRCLKFRSMRRNADQLLARLLADPDREYHVLDLVAVESGHGPHVDRSQATNLRRSAFGDAGEILDARAKDAYRRRLAEIEDDIDQARTSGDADRAAARGC